MKLGVLLALLGVLFVIGCGGDDSGGNGADQTAGSETADTGGASEQERAIAAAMEAYDQAVADGVDLSDGPCIAEELPGLPAWVADVAHDPREDVDDDPANQCERFRAGEADHFVELTPEGELITAQ